MGVKARVKAIVHDGRQYPEKDPRDQLDLRERILDRARAAADLPEPFRRRAILGLLHDRFRSVFSCMDPRADQPPACTESELFELWCGDATGREYWAGVLYPGKTDAPQLAWTLAVHISRSEEEFQHVRKTLSEALAPISNLSAREMVECLLDDPETRRFVPALLQEFVLHDMDNGVTSENFPSHDQEAIETNLPRGPLPEKIDALIAHFKAIEWNGKRAIEVLGKKLAEDFGVAESTVSAAKKRYREIIAAQSKSARQEIKSTPKNSEIH
jgi:hypothetical protein